MARDPHRIKLVLEQLEEYWKARPDLRLAQVLTTMQANYARARKEKIRQDLFYVEDEVFLEQLTIENERSR